MESRTCTFTSCRGTPAPRGSTGGLAWMSGRRPGAGATPKLARSQKLSAGTWPLLPLRARARATAKPGRAAPVLGLESVVLGLSGKARGARGAPEADPLTAPLGDVVIQRAEPDDAGEDAARNSQPHRDLHWP